jgi:hypothetical protein
MRVDDIGPFTQHLTVDLQQRDSVTDRKLTAHLFNKHGLYTMLLREITHVLLALRHPAGDQGRMKLAVRCFFREPDNVPRGPAHVQSSNDAEDFHDRIRVV